MTARFHARIGRSALRFFMLAACLGSPLAATAFNLELDVGTRFGSFPLRTAASSAWDVFAISGAFAARTAGTVHVGP